MVTDLAQLLGQPGQLELESDSEGQPVWHRGYIQTTDTKTDPPLIHIYNPRLCPRPKVVSLVLFTLKTNTSSCFFFPWTLIYVRIHCWWQWRWGLGGAQAEAQAWLAFIALPWNGLIWMVQARHACRDDPALLLIQVSTSHWRWSLTTLLRKECLLWPSLVNIDKHIYLQLSMKLMLHPPELHHCLGLKAKGGKWWVSVRDSPGDSTWGLQKGSMACKEALDPLKRNSLLMLF